MKRVRLLTSMAGDGFHHHSGDEISMSDVEAERFVSRGLAVVVAERSVSATAKSRETRKIRN